MPIQRKDAHADCAELSAEDGAPERLREVARDRAPMVTDDQIEGGFGRRAAHPIPVNGLILLIRECELDPFTLAVTSCLCYF
jgi:hypothetical protein